MVTPGDGCDEKQVPDTDLVNGPLLPPRHWKHNEDFRRDAVELVRSSGRTLRDVGRELGVNHETLRGWVNAAKRADEQRAGRSADSGQLSGAERLCRSRIRFRLRRLLILIDQPV